MQKALESVVNNANNANVGALASSGKKTDNDHSKGVSTPKKRALNTATDLSEPLVVPNEEQTSAP